MQGEPADGIAMDACVERGVYQLRSRNLLVGVWVPSRRGFIGVRTKFGERYLFTEYHWDTGPPYGTATPLSLLGMLPAGVELREQNPTCCRACEQLCEFLPPVEGAEGAVGRWRHSGDHTPLCEGSGPYSSGYEPLFAYLDPLDQQLSSRR